MSPQIEPENAVAFKAWLVERGGQFHSDVRFVANAAGMSLVAHESLLPDTKIVECPFDIAITPQKSRQALSTLFKGPEAANLDTWTERQLICSYICFHWVIEDSSSTALTHSPYLKILPTPEMLLTPLHFTPIEIEAFKGTNMYGAALGREHAWRDEWSQCRSTITTVDPAWGNGFTWERYLTASTYLSSRAFPSTLLSPTPSLTNSPVSYPVLLPGIDSLNHARAHAVSWVVFWPEIIVLPPVGTARRREPCISLVIHSPTSSGQELFNNYGPKANSELILGYGFSIPQNPDDTITLQIGGHTNPGQKRDIGRHASGADGLWEELLGIVSQNTETEEGCEDELEAAALLADMTQTLLDRLPESPDRVKMRPEVALMLDHYLEGQRDVLLSVLEFARGKDQAAVEQVRMGARYSF